MSTLGSPSYPPRNHRAATTVPEETADADPSPVLRIRDLTVEFRIGRSWTTVIDQVHLHVGHGRTVGLVGESGSGKSVTALATMGLLPRGVARVASGSAQLHGRELFGIPRRDLNHIRGREMAMIFQEPTTSLNPAFTVGDQIAEAIRHHEDADRNAAWERACDMLALVGIPRAGSRAQDYPHAFSGGMRQRVMIAMALACEPRLLIADEPTTALDATVQAQILDLLRDLQAELGLSIILVTHDLGVIAEMCQDVAVMYAGQVVEQAPAAALFERPQHPYTEGLLRGMPERGTPGEALPTIPGVVPTPGAWPTGCHFAPRCEYSVEGWCDQGSPELESIGDHSSRCVRRSQLDLEGER